MSRQQLILIFLLFCALPVWSQQDDQTNSGNATANSGEDRMVLPATLNGEGLSLDFSSEADRGNTLRGGLSFVTAYDDNVFSTNNTGRLSDLSFSVAPYIGIDLSRPRTNWSLTYAPGYTFYRRYDALNQNDQSLNTALSYRMTQHVTLNLLDTFSKTGTYFGPFTQSIGQSNLGGLQQPNQSIIPPIADRLGNEGSAGLSYQFGRNSMFTMRGTSYELFYPNSSQAGGLSDTHSQGAEGTYSHRISREHLIGATYRFQRIITDATATTGQLQTYSHSALLSYTFNPRPTLTFTLLGGPQYSDIGYGIVGQQPLRSWSPVVGASFGWQGLHTSFGANFMRQVSDGGGLAATMRMTGGDTLFRWQWAKTWTMALGGSYTNNLVLNGSTDVNGKGHTILGLVSLNHTIGPHLEVGVGYTRTQQRWSGQPGALSSAIDHNRPQISITYNFERPLGR